MKTLRNFTYYTIFFIFLQIPSYADVVIINGLTFEHKCVAGNTVKGVIRMRNDGSQSKKMVMYKEELFFLPTGQSTYKDTIPHPQSSSNWVKTNVNEKVIDGGELYDLVYEVNVPQNTPPGTYYTMIMVESAEAMPQIDPNTTIAINSKVRYGIAVLTHVGTIESPKLNFENINLEKNGDEYLLKTLLKNQGNYAALTHLSLEIYRNGEKIKVLKDQDDQFLRVYPFKNRVFTTHIKDLPKGKYDGVLVADNGLELFATNLTLKIE